jgi:hypothetical protein
MQNRYVGDVGDFAKYALLRSISQGSPDALRLAVIWYLYPNEIHNSDGRHVGYLRSESYRALDPELHTAMIRLVGCAKRSVAEVRKAALLPPGTIFFEEPTVSDLGSVVSSRGREAFRMEWFSRAQTATMGADIVFLDPDNGIEIRSVPKGAARAGKYVFWNEIEALWTRGQSLVIYHHLNRTMSIRLQTKALRRRFNERLARPALLLSPVFRRGSCRHFWVVGQSDHAGRLKSRIEGMLKLGWSGHFDIE